MARETFEDQAQAVRRVTGSANKADRKHLECAARNLEAFGLFRRRLLQVAENDPTEEQLESIAEEIVALLHIPIPGS